MKLWKAVIYHKIGFFGFSIFRRRLIHKNNGNWILFSETALCGKTFTTRRCRRSRFLPDHPLDAAEIISTSCFRHDQPYQQLCARSFIIYAIISATNFCPAEAHTGADTKGSGRNIFLRDLINWMVKWKVQRRVISAGCGDRAGFWLVIFAEWIQFSVLNYREVEWWSLSFKLNFKLKQLANLTSQNHISQLL